MTWCRTTAEGVLLNLRIVPRASRNEVAGVLGDALKIRLQAPPVEGKANAALVRFLADKLVVPARDVVLVSGSSARNKRVLVRGLDEHAVRSRLGAGPGVGHQ
ncbi:MAG: DUF167 family protein [Verrucomicrobiota bacterium]